MDTNNMNTINDRIRYATITAYHSLTGTTDGSYIYDMVRRAARSDAPTDSIRYDNGVWHRLSDYPDLVFKARVEELARNIRRRWQIKIENN